MMTMYTYELNYFAFRDALDVISWDNYPEWHNPYMGNEEVAKDCAMTHDMMRSLQKAVPAHGMHAERHQLAGRQQAEKAGDAPAFRHRAVAHGADSGSTSSCARAGAAVRSSTRRSSPTPARKTPGHSGKSPTSVLCWNSCPTGYTAAARRRKRRSCSTRKTNGRWTNARGQETSGWTISGISAGTTAISGKTASMWISSTAPLTSAATSW